MVWRTLLSALDDINLRTLAHDMQQMLDSLSPYIALYFVLFSSSRLSSFEILSHDVPHYVCLNRVII